MKITPDIIVITDKDQSDLALEIQIQEAGFFRIGFYSSREALIERADSLVFPFILLDEVEEVNFDIEQLKQMMTLNTNVSTLKVSQNTGQSLVDIDGDLNIVSYAKKSQDFIDGYITGGVYLIQSIEALADIDFSSCSWKGLPMSFRDEFVPSSHYRSALLLDRDGIINVDTKYLHKFEDVQIYEDIVPIIKYFNERNLPVCVVTNQSGVARGMYSEDDVVELHKKMGDLLKEMGCEVNAWFYSPYHQSGQGKYKKESLLRKPHAAMALQAATELPIRLSTSIMIGDKASDHLDVFGLKTIHIQRGEDLTHAKGLVVDSLKAALDHIVSILD